MQRRSRLKPQNQKRGELARGLPGNNRIPKRRGAGLSKMPRCAAAAGVSLLQQREVGDPLEYLGCVQRTWGLEEEQGCGLPPALSPAHSDGGPHFLPAYWNSF
ncbi:hypothetical protein NDU88_008042 [Pleurodeles waltl]|uniref:Uncharacterized protein n=1 Tax=Pleurodeles waltl TaxID=8319 RepID=A0AAV7RS12_PLEWA|nr:hypothetical protein NDU88_008042 [Pleurodeles waltl]